MNLENIIKMIENNGGRIFKNYECIGDHYLEERQGCEKCLIDPYKSSNYSCIHDYAKLLELMRNDLRKKKLAKLLNK